MNLNKVVIIGLVSIVVGGGVLLYDKQHTLELYNKKLNKENKILRNNIKILNEKFKSINVNVNVDNNKSKENLIFSFEKQDLKQLVDFEYHSSISEENRNRIVSSILSSSKKYNINPLLIYSIIKTESDFRWWIVHPLVKVHINKGKKRKSIKTRGIGLGGVIWEIWRDDLQKNNICSVKSDLFDIDKNIESISFILSYYMKFKKTLKNVDNSLESALLRYYGNNGTTTYLNKIKKTLSDLVLFKLSKKEINNEQQNQND